MKKDYSWLEQPTQQTEPFREVFRLKQIAWQENQIKGKKVFELELVEFNRKVALWEAEDYLRRGK